MISDKNMSPAGYAGSHALMMQLGTTAVSQTNKRTHSIKPPFTWKIKAIQVYALTVAATISVAICKNNAIGNIVTTAPLTPVADTVVLGTLLATAAGLALLQGLSSDSIDLLYTSNGSGAATNGFVVVWVRPYPGAAEY